MLKQIHDELDAAVFDAYGWPHDLSDEEILERLVALNHERAEEEKRGLIRWLRPEFQNPAGGKPSVQNELALEDDSDDEESDESGSVADRPEQRKKGKGARSQTGPSGASAKKSTKETKSAWPKKLPEQIAAVRQALQSHKGPAAPDIIASRFKTVKPPPSKNSSTPSSPSARLDRRRMDGMWCSVCSRAKVPVKTLLYIGDESSCILGF